MKKTSFVTLASLIIIISGCVKETYEMDKLSKKMQLNASVVLPLFRGNMTLKDALKNTDSVGYDNDNFVRLIFKSDSVICDSINEFFNTENMVSFSDSYTLGDVVIDPFQGILSMSLDQITRRFSSSLRSTFVSLDNGAPHQFPPFPAVIMPLTAFSTFSNLQSATFSSGFLDLSVTNNLTAPLNDITISLSGNTGPVAGPLTLPAVLPGETKTIAVDLTGKTLTNVLNGTVTFSGSPGNTNPVMIDLDNSFVVFRAKGRNLKVTSGRIILPSQVISGTGSKDTATINPGEGIELQQAKLKRGMLDWRTNSTLPLYAAVNLTFPGIARNSAIYTQVINIIPGRLIEGTTSAANTTIDFTKDPEQPFNRVPLAYDITVTSNNTFINFNSTDQIQLSINLKNPQFDFIKGYFGQRTESIDEFVDVSKILDSIDGQFSITDPRLRLFYYNSFGIPSKFDFKATGSRNVQSVSLDLNNISIAAPDIPAHYDASGSIEINKNNSSISQFISLPPGKIEYKGTVMMNPAGDPGHLRNNYVFGNSRLLVNVEVEVPLELSLNNFQLNRTMENKLKDILSNTDLESLELGLITKNGFPVDLAGVISLSDNGVTVSSIEVPSLIKSGIIDGTGKITSMTTTEAKISLTKDFIEKAKTADKIILTLRITTSGSKVVRIYSDYSVDFTLSISGKAAVKPNL